MRKRIETLAAAVALAEGGLHEDAQALLHELAPLRESARRKFVLLASITGCRPRLLHNAAALARRLGFDLLVCLRARPGDSPRAARRVLAQACRQIGDRLVTETDELRAVCIMDRREPDQILGEISTLVPGLEFAVVAGMALPERAELPVFYAS